MAQCLKKIKTTKRKWFPTRPGGAGVKQTEEVTGRNEFKRPCDATSSSPRRRANNERRVLIIQKSPRRLRSTLHVCRAVAAVVVEMAPGRSKVNDTIVPFTLVWSLLVTHTGDLNASHSDSRGAFY